MLNVKHDHNRILEQGRFFVELVNHHNIRLGGHTDRLGYWCDEPHLLTMLDEINLAIESSKKKPVAKRVIKPLEWIEHISSNGWEVASTPLGEFSLAHEGGQYFFNRTPWGSTWGSWKTKAEAKSAAFEKLNEKIAAMMADEMPKENQ